MAAVLREHNWTRENSVVDFTFSPSLSAWAKYWTRLFSLWKRHLDRHEVLAKINSNPIDVHVRRFDDLATKIVIFRWLIKWNNESARYFFESQQPLPEQNMKFWSQPFGSIPLHVRICMLRSVWDTHYTPILDITKLVFFFFFPHASVCQGFC